MLWHTFSKLGANSRNDAVEFVIDLANQDDRNKESSGLITRYLMRLNDFFKQD